MNANAPHVEAGHGDFAQYKPWVDGTRQEPGTPLRATQDYVQVSAARWWVNRDSSFWRDRTASGTSQIVLGNERYEVALGTYELKDGAHTAPVFGRTILPTRRYPGGGLAIKLVVGIIGRNTMLASVLSDMAEASLQVVEGAISTATAAGPSAILGAAGTSLIGSVKNVLKSDDQGEEVFSEGGQELTIDADKVCDGDTWYLYHRGTSLVQDHLDVRTDDSPIPKVFYDGNELEDGAWVLLRLRRPATYDRERPWWNDSQRAVNEISELIARWKLERLGKAEALAEIGRGTSTNTTVGDRVFEVVYAIDSDFALTEIDQTQARGILLGLLDAAQQAIRAKDASIYEQAHEAMHKTATAGQPITAPPSPRPEPATTEDEGPSASALDLPPGTFTLTGVSVPAAGVFGSDAVDALKANLTE